jgi:hypothetical protein
VPFVSLRSGQYTLIGTVILGAIELRRAAKAKQGEFLLQLHDDFFFRPTLRPIRKAIDGETLAIEVRGLLPTDPPYAPPDPASKPAEHEDADDVDDYLGYLELVESFLRADMLDPAVAKDMFGHYVDVALKDPSIRYYIQWVNNYPGQSGPFYTRLRDLDDRFKR